MRRFTLEQGSDVATLLAGLVERDRFERDPDRTVERTVYDTFDWRLHAAGTVLEHERTVVARGGRARGRGRSTARPKAAPLAGDQGEAWLVWRSLETGEVLGRIPVAEVPNFAWELPAGPVADRLAPILEMRSLLPLATVRSDRSALRLVDDEGKALSRVVIDRSRSVRPDRALAPVVEVAGVRGYDRATERVVDLLAAQVVLRPAGEDAIQQALALAGLTPGDYSSKLKLRLDPSGTALDTVATVLATLRAAMDVNEPGTRADTDSEFLHDYRVAVRRSRSVLGMAKGVVDAEWLDHLRGEFKWLGDITTPTRDFDVYLLSFPDFEAALPEPMRGDLGPLRTFLVAHHAQAQRELVAQLDSPRYEALMARYRSWLADPRPLAGPAADDPAPAFAAARTWKAYRSLVRDARRIDDSSPPERLHDLRKDAKKLRYALECFGSLFPPERVAPLVKELKGVQDVLGEFQDCEVQKGSLRSFGQQMVEEGGAGSAGALLAMGYLIEQLDDRERRARAEFAERFARFDRHDNRAGFHELFAPTTKEPPA